MDEEQPETNSPSFSLGLSPTGKPYTFFLIDDSGFMHKSLIELICSMGGEVVGKALNGIEAMAQLRALNTHIDIITLDIHMPILSGISLLPMLKAIIPTTKIAMVSAMGKPEVIKHAISLGADHFILKPFKPDHVFRVFQFLCNKETKTKFGQPMLRNQNQDLLGVLGLVKSDAHAKTIHTILEWLGCNILGVSTEEGEVLSRQIHLNKNVLDVFIMDIDVATSTSDKIFGEIFRANSSTKIILLTTNASPESIENIKTLDCYSKLTLANDESLFEVMAGFFTIS